MPAERRSPTTSPHPVRPIAITGDVIEGVGGTPTGAHADWRHIDDGGTDQGGTQCASRTCNATESPDEVTPSRHKYGRCPECDGCALRCAAGSQEALAVSSACRICHLQPRLPRPRKLRIWRSSRVSGNRSEEHTSELQSLRHLVCRLL